MIDYLVLGVDMSSAATDYVLMGWTRMLTLTGVLRMDGETPCGRLGWRLRRVGGHGPEDVEATSLPRSSMPIVEGEGFSRRFLLPMATVIMIRTGRRWPSGVVGLLTAACPWNVSTSVDMGSARHGEKLVA